MRGPREEGLEGRPVTVTRVGADFRGSEPVLLEGQNRGQSGARVREGDT